MKKLKVKFKLSWHGKSVEIIDFASKDENEHPVLEVAVEDPKTPGKWISNVLGTVVANEENQEDKLQEIEKFFEE